MTVREVQGALLNPADLEVGLYTGQDYQFIRPIGLWTMRLWQFFKGPESIIYGR